MSSDPYVECVGFPNVDNRLAAYFSGFAPFQEAGSWIATSCRDGISLVAYSDLEVQEIQRLLSLTHNRWARVPRMYIVLRILGELPLLDKLIEYGCTDYWFPVSRTDLPSFVGSQIKTKIIDMQPLILSKGMNLEKGKNGRHAYFAVGEPLPFEVKAILGTGRFSQVEKVLSLISYKEYARKLIARRALFMTTATTMASYETELEVLKRLEHIHIVDFVGSYTDPDFVSIIMSPVADCDLASFFELASSSAEHKSLLRTFFGCLATGLAYLHDSRVRHKDIKPSNILVKNGNVMLADFGLSRDSQDKSQSISMGLTALTPAYCAPEVAAFMPRHYSSDIWSLGCVFLEMVGILKGKTLKNMKDFFGSRGSRVPHVLGNAAGCKQWSTLLPKVPGVEDNAPLEWVQKMLRKKVALRPSAMVIAFQATQSARFSGICCRSRTILRNAESNMDMLSEPSDAISKGTQDVLTVTTSAESMEQTMPTPLSRSGPEQPSPAAIEKAKDMLLTSWLWHAAKRGNTNDVIELLTKGAHCGDSTTKGSTAAH